MNDLLLLVESSLAFPLAKRGKWDKIWEDLETTLQYSPEVVGFTEIHRFKRKFRRRLPKLGYKFVDPGEGDGAFAVRNDVKVLDSGSEFVFGGHSGSFPGHGGRGHGPKTIEWVKVQWKGNIVFAHITHWVTGYHRSPQRKQEHIAQTKTMAKITSRHGKGSRLSFFMGDVNISEDRDQGQDPHKPDAIFEDANLITCWDELGKTPPTHDKLNTTIDIIGSNERDGRVECVGAGTYKNQHKDHLDVWAEYSVKRR